MNIGTLLEAWRREARTGPCAREMLEPDGRLLNFHGRVVRRPPAEVFRRLGRLGSGLDDLWPIPALPMRTEGRLAVGVRASHGASRYACVAVEDGRSIAWHFTMELMHGVHTYAMDVDASGTYVEHVIDGAVSGIMLARWKDAIGPFHDWIIERLLERLETPPLPWIERELAQGIR